MNRDEESGARDIVAARGGWVRVERRVRWPNRVIWQGESPVPLKISLAWRCHLRERWDLGQSRLPDLQGCGKDLPTICCTYCGATNGIDLQDCYACHRPLPKPVDPKKIGVVKFKIILCSSAILILAAMNFRKLNGPCIAATGPAIGLLMFYVSQFRETRKKFPAA